MYCNSAVWSGILVLHVLLCSTFQPLSAWQLVTERSNKPAPTGSKSYTALPLHLRSAVFSSPAYYKIQSNRTSEDAYFRSAKDMGVMDGVGEWHSRGVDSGRYATRLAQLIAAYCNIQRKTDSNSSVDQLQALLFAEEACRLEKTIGSCTTCLLSLDEVSQTISIATLGDCGALLLRKKVATGEYEVMHQTKAQYHAENLPYQVGANFTSTCLQEVVGFDSPKLAQLNFIPIQQKDLIILGSDGIFDNLFPEEISQCVSNVCKQTSELTTGEQLAQISNTLGSKCTERAQNTVVVTPWSQGKIKQKASFGLGMFNSLVRQFSGAAVEESDEGSTGGKDDDLTIIVAMVSRDEVENNEIK